MFDRYYVSGNFICPNCGIVQDCKKSEFQTEDLRGNRALYKLGDVIDSSLAKIRFLKGCSELHDRLDTTNPNNPKVIKGRCLGCFWCYVYLDNNKKAFKERIVALDYGTELQVLVYEKKISIPV